jgi:septal ring factor EnvC (AmiA/AmiB activator)
VLDTVNSEEFMISMLKTHANMLELLTTDVTETKQVLRKLMLGQELLMQGQAKLEQGQTKLEQDVAALAQGQTKLEQDVSSLTQDVSSLKKDVVTLTQGQARLETELAKVKADVQQTKERVIIIENRHGEQLGGLEDGHVVLLGYAKKASEDIAELKKREEWRDLRILKVESERKRRATKKV